MGPHHIGSYRIEAGLSVGHSPPTFWRHEEGNHEAQSSGTGGLSSGSGIRPSGGRFQLAKRHADGHRKQKVKEGSTITHNTDASAKDRGNKTDYSSNSTTTKSDNYENYQVYTIESGNIVYVASEHLLFPWSKAADITWDNPFNSR